jgi:hypothetical protein
MGKNIPENKRKYMKEYSQRPHAKELRYQVNKKIRTSPKGKYSSYRFAAIRRNKKFDLSEHQFLELLEDPCFYCGEFEKTRGIDRFDNSIDYLIENCVACCSYCNQMKHAYDAEDFVYHCKKVADYFLPE